MDSAAAPDVDIDCTSNLTNDGQMARSIPIDETQSNQATPGASFPDRAATVRPVANPAFRMAEPVAMAGEGDRLERNSVVDESEHSAKPIKGQKLSTQSSSRLIENTATYRKSDFKKSRIKKGWLIRRLAGYSIAETEYGVSYLWVLSRKPDRTSADNSVWPLAGYFNWKSLEQSGLLRKEKKIK